METKQQSRQAAVITEMKRLPDLYELRWNDGYCGQYPFIWLRDNCRCPACYYPSSKQRSSLLLSIDIDIQPEKEELFENGQEFKIFWTDGHVSHFPSEWLCLLRFEKTDFDSVAKLDRKPWGSEMAEKVPKFDFHSVMEDSRALRDWLRSLYVGGLTVLTGAPKAEGVIDSLGKRVGHLRTTMFGKNFQVVAIGSSSNLAYTTKRLGLHVDLPMYDLPPSVQMLHCIKQCAAKGGENQFCDVMKVANDLKVTDPEVYDTLTKVNVDFRVKATDFIPFHYQHGKPTIILDNEGNFVSVRYNNSVRAPYLNVPAEKVKGFYRCLQTFEGKLYDKENLISFKLKEGEVVAFDNNRVMHGRSEFRLIEQPEDAGKKTRHLEGGYMDWDSVKSCIRLLDEELDGFPVL